MNRLRIAAALAVSLAATAPVPAATAANADPAAPADVAITPMYLTLRDEPANIDSVAAWHDGHGRHWLLATAKAANQVRVYNADNGAPIATVGADDGIDLARPNGIAVADDMAFVVERDHARVAVLALPSLRPIGYFGAGHLARPYGIWIGPDDNGHRPVYITDDYENADGSRPSDTALGHRLQRFQVARDGDGLKAEWQQAMGPTEGPGALRKVESIAGDPARDRLLVADEATDQRDIKLFDRAGRFTGRTIGHGLFEHDPEGIALVRCGNGSGYWIATDQSDNANRFRVFDRGDLSYRGAFTSAAVTNTDGIGVTQHAMPHFPRGALFAVNDDGNIAALDLGAVNQALGPASCRAAAPETGPKASTKDNAT